MAAGTKDEPREEAAGERLWSPVPPPSSMPQLPNDRLGFAGSGLFGLGTLLVSAPPKPDLPETPVDIPPEPMAVSVAAVEAFPEADAAVWPEVMAAADPVSEPEVFAPAEAEVPVALATESKAEAVAQDHDRPDPMPDLIADLNRRMHGIEQRLDITLLEIEQATRELRDAASDQREAAEMLRAMHLHQRAAPREDKPAPSGIRPASLAASDLVPPAAMAKAAATDSVMTSPFFAAAQQAPASIETAASQPMIATAIDEPAQSVSERVGASAAPSIDPGQTSGATSVPHPAPDADDRVPEMAAKDEPPPAAADAAPAAPAPDLPAPEAVTAIADVAQASVAAPANPARGLRWLVLALILIAIIVWLLGPGRGYFAQAFDPRGWSATIGWAASGLDQAHDTLVEWSDAVRRIIRG